MKKNVLIKRLRKRFNRYMVECESGKASYYYDDGTAFNRYMVECESVKYS